MASDVSSTVVGGTALNHSSFFCKSLPVSCLIDERQLIFFNKLQHTDNPIMRTLFHLPTVKYEILGLAAKYGLIGVQGNFCHERLCMDLFCAESSILGFWFILSSM